eukprot:Polyplicarium_translucidae@DN1947_c0_g1_i1.p1
MSSEHRRAPPQTPASERSMPPPPLFVRKEPLLKRMGASGQFERPYGRHQKLPRVVDERSEASDSIASASSRSRPPSTPIGTPSYMMNSWAPSTRPGIGTPLIFKGTSRRARVLDGKNSMLVMGLRGPREDEVACAGENGVVEGLTDPLIREVSESRTGYEEPDVKLDRMWYDVDEGSYFQHEGDAEEDQQMSNREDKLKKQQALLAKRNVNIRDSVRNADQDVWEMNRLRQSGMAERQESDLVFVVEEEDAVHVMVREITPPFLDGKVIHSRQTDAVSVVRDETSDLVVLAKRGSLAVRQLREQQDRTKMRQRFWELAGSNLGELLGVKKVENKDDEEGHGVDEDNMDYKQDSRYAEAFKSSKMGAVSTFALTKTLKEQREALPVFDVKDELLGVLRDHNVVIVVGQTGSGKTTQLTQFLHEAGYTALGSIGCTQPRRVAAVSVAKRVADEMSIELGGTVGYAIRFEDCTSSRTLIKYMTDGVLLRETLVEPDLERYSCVIMDEAHERSLNTDVLFGILRQLVARRRDFKLIVTSATMDAGKFSRFFGDCPIFEIPGRTFPVKIEYERSPADDYVEAAVQKCLQLHCSTPNDGDILVFMTGQDDIEACCIMIADRVALLREKVPPLTVLPIYSQLPSDLQAKIFQKSEYRKVVVATNIAETSLTVDGVRYVIDSGYCKMKVYNPKIGMDSLQITPVSQANAQQRAGRAGRTGPGICHRLFTETAFVSELLDNNIPEIQRTNLSNVVLLLKSLGVKNLLDFDFMDPPPQQTVLNSMYQLWVIGALNNNGELTGTGKQMVQFPLDPPLSKMLLSSKDLGCSAEVLLVVSMLSVPSVFFRPKDRAEESDAAREKFFVPESDHLTLLNVYQNWKRNSYGSTWCGEHYLHFKGLKKAREVRAQLLDIMQTLRIEHLSCGTDWDPVRKAICSGYFHNASKLRGIGEYVNLRTSIPCHLHPTSSLYGAGYTPEYIVYHEVVMTTKEYMSNVTAVDPNWLAELGPMFFYLKETGKGRSDQWVKDREATEQQQKEFQKKLQQDRECSFVRNEEEKQKQKKLFRLATPGMRPQTPRDTACAFPPRAMTPLIGPAVAAEGDIADEIALDRPVPLTAKPSGVPEKTGKIKSRAVTSFEKRTLCTD